MAVTFTDAFTGTLDDTLEGRTGWTTSGAFPADRAGLKINASNQAKNSSGNGCLAFVEAGSADSYSEADVFGPLAAGTNISLAVRCTDWQNFIGVRAWTSSELQLYHMNSGTLSALQQITGLSLSAGDTWRLEVESDTARVYVNNVQVGTDEDVTGMQSGSKVGIFAANAAVDPVFDNFEAGTIGVASIVTITEEADRKVYPHVSDAASKTIAGTYVGTPTAIEYRAEDYDSGTVLTGHDWQTLDAAPSGGTYSGSVSLPKGDWIRIRTRFSNDTGINSQTTNRFGVGYLVENAGQSNAVSQFTTGSVLTPDDRTAIFDGSSVWSLPTTEHAIGWMNQLASEESCVVGAFDTGAGSSSIVAHIPSGGNYPAREAALNAAGGDINFMLWCQGEADASVTMAKATYSGHLTTLYNDILTRTSRSAADLPLFIVVTGREEGVAGNDAGWQNIREAQTEFADATAHVEVSAHAVTYGMDDSLHYDTASKALLSLCIGQSITKKYGNSTYDGLGPKVTSAEWGSSTLVLNHDLNGSSGISLTGSASGYEISTDDFSTTETIVSSVGTGDTITFTMGSTLSGTVKVRSYYGQDPDTSNVAEGDLIAGQPVEAIVSPITATEAVSPTFTGNITNQSHTIGDTVNIDISSNWSGSPTAFAVTSGTLPSGVTLSSAGVLSGTVDTIQALTGIVITGSNFAGSAVSNTFTWDVVPVAVPAFSGTLVDWSTGSPRANLTGNKIAISATFGGDVVGSVQTFSTDANGDFSVEYPGAADATEYFCQLSDSGEVITELHKLTAAL